MVDAVLTTSGRFARSWMSLKSRSRIPGCIMKLFKRLKRRKKMSEKTESETESPSTSPSGYALLSHHLLSLTLRTAQLENLVSRLLSAHFAILSWGDYQEGCGRITQLEKICRYLNDFKVMEKTDWTPAELESVPFAGSFLAPFTKHIRPVPYLISRDAVDAVMAALYADSTMGENSRSGIQ